MVVNVNVAVILVNIIFQWCIFLNKSVGVLQLCFATALGSEEVY